MISKSLGILLTNECNKSCNNCLVPKDNVQSIQNSTLNNLLELFFCNGTKSFWLSGGEIFLYPDKVFNIIEKSSQLNLSMSRLYTNGLLLNNYLLKYYFKLILKNQQNPNLVLSYDRMHGINESTEMIIRILSFIIDSKYSPIITINCSYFDQNTSNQDVQNLLKSIIKMGFEIKMNNGNCILCEFSGIKLIINQKHIIQNSTTLQNQYQQSWVVRDLPLIKDNIIKVFSYNGFAYHDIVAAYAGIQYGYKYHFVDSSLVLSDMINSDFYKLLTQYSAGFLFDKLRTIVPDIKKSDFSTEDEFMLFLFRFYEKLGIN